MLNSLSLPLQCGWMVGTTTIAVGQPASQPDCLSPSLPPSLPACVRVCLPTRGACLPRVCLPGIPSGCPTSGCISGNPFKETLRLSGQSKARMAEPAENGHLESESLSRYAHLHTGRRDSRRARMSYSVKNGNNRRTVSYGKKKAEL